MEICEQSRSQIKIVDSNDNLRPIQQFGIRVGWKGLGIVASPDGKWQDHIKYSVKEKIAPWNISTKTHSWKNKMYTELSLP